MIVNNHVPLSTLYIVPIIIFYLLFILKLGIFLILMIFCILLTIPTVIIASNLTPNLLLMDVSPIRLLNLNFLLYKLYVLYSLTWPQFLYLLNNISYHFYFSFPPDHQDADDEHTENWDWYNSEDMVISTSLIQQFYPNHISVRADVPKLFIAVLLIL
jgi:hypothetical protein